MALSESTKHTFFSLITWLGHPVFYSVFLLILALSNSSLAWHTFLALIFIEVVCVIIKISYRKERPVPQSREGIYNKIDANSFPSAHSARIALLATAVTLFYKDIIIGTIAILIMIAVGYSRIYLKRHHAIDVVSGFLIGIIAAMCMLNIWN